MPLGSSLACSTVGLAGAAAEVELAVVPKSIVVLLPSPSFRPNNTGEQIAMGANKSITRMDKNPLPTIVDRWRADNSRVWIR